MADRLEAARRVWWCETHRAFDSTKGFQKEPRCWKGYALQPGDCKMEEGRFAPEGSLVIVRDLDPEFGDEWVWPEWAIRTLQQSYEDMDTPAETFDALASGSEQETG